MPGARTPLSSRPWRAATPASRTKPCTAARSSQAPACSGRGASPAAWRIRSGGPSRIRSRRRPSARRPRTGPATTTTGTRSPRGTTSSSGGSAAIAACPSSGALTPRRLRIGIDAHVIGDRLTGNERVMANLIPELRELCDHDLFLYFTHPEVAASWPRGAQTQVKVLKLARRILRIPFTLPYRARADRLDVLFVQYTAPPVLSCPVVTVVHD